MLNEKILNEILSIAPKGASCYTGQSALAACPDPTFSWEELNLWPTATDVDIFCYNIPALATTIQAYISVGWKPDAPVDKFKCDAIRFREPTHKFNIQTVKLRNELDVQLNITWKKNCQSAMDVIRSYDMDYVMVAMDLKTGVWVDLRGKDHRVAHVNHLNSMFDPYDANPAYWYRQFERCPKGWSRGIDTRPVAKQYVEWIDASLVMGDCALGSKTREYKDKAMSEAIVILLDAGYSEEQAEAMYKMVKGEASTWEATRIKHQAMRDRIQAWLDEVNEL